MSARVELFACETCGGKERATHGSSAGERLLGLLKSAAETAEIEVKSVRCLWLCKRSCAVHLCAPNRPGYVLAELEASAEVAHALVDYARRYRESPDGSVPFREWPAALRGHFVCRLPALLPAASED